MLRVVIRAFFADDLVEAAKGGIDGSPFPKNKLTEQMSRGLAKEVKEEENRGGGKYSHDLQGCSTSLFLPTSTEKFTCYKCQWIVSWEEKVKGLNAKLSVSKFIREAEEVLH